MQDLISRQAAIDEVNRLAKFFWEKWHEYAPSTIAVTDALKEIPSAQPEIIRCKDCMHFHKDVWGNEIGHPEMPIILGHEMCDFWGSGCKTKQGAFCSYAERRTDDE